MPFSRRTRWDLSSNSLARLLESKRQAQEEVFDLTQSNPTCVGLDYPDGLLAPLAQPAALRYEPAPFGLPAARAAVAADFARRGFPLDPSRIVLTASTSEAYAFLLKLLCDPGDEVLVPHPGYPLFEYLASLESVRLAGYACVHDGEWRIDLPVLRKAVGPRTRVVLLVNPNNPTGAYLKRPELDALEALCVERGLVLVSDEVFADFEMSQDPGRVGSLARDGAVLAFCLGGLSKTCGLPQLKLAWIAVSGPEPAREEALRRLELIADTYLSVATPVQLAAPDLLARRDELQAPIRKRLAANLDALRARLAAGGPATLLEPEGGWYAVLRVPATLAEEERVTRLLAERNVLVHPGYFFDFPRDAHLVLSLLPPEPVFAEGVGRLLDSLVL